MGLLLIPIVVWGSAVGLLLSPIVVGMEQCCGAVIELHSGGYGAVIEQLHGPVVCFPTSPSESDIPAKVNSPQSGLGRS